MNSSPNKDEDQDTQLMNMVWKLREKECLRRCRPSCEYECTCYALPSARAWVGGISGGLFAAGWWLLVDVLVHQRSLELWPKVDASIFVPAFISTLGFGLSLIVPVEALEHSFQSNNRMCAHLCLFCSGILVFSGVMAAAATYISMNTAQEVSPLPDNLDVTPGSFALISGLCIFLSFFACTYLRFTRSSTEVFG